MLIASLLLIISSIVFSCNDPREVDAEQQVLMWPSGPKKISVNGKEQNVSLFI